MARFSTPVKTFLNCTMPALVNISVGSLRGTSELDGDDLVPALGEEPEEARSNLVDAAHEHAALDGFPEALSRARRARRQRDSRTPRGGRAGVTDSTELQEKRGARRPPRRRQTGREGGCRRPRAPRAHEDQPAPWRGRASSSGGGREGAPEGAGLSLRRRPRPTDRRFRECGRRSGRRSREWRARSAPSSPDWP